MICAAIAIWVPIASMVMIAPWMSTSLRSSGMAVISFDFSAHATCPSDRPNSLAQTLTECKAPRPLVRSWLRRAVLPSTARMGWSTPVAAVASVRNDCSQLAKQAWKAAGFKAIRTRRKTSLLGIPLGKSRTCKRNSCFRTAHCAIAVGPPAPASTASKAMTTTLSKGCRRLISERGSSSSSKCRMISSIPIRCASAMVHPPGALLLEKPHRGRYTRKQPRAQALQITKITYKCALALGRPPIDPRILFALWLYATTRGVGSARLLDELCREKIDYQWICGNVSVNYHTLADFRRDHGGLLDDLLTQSVAVLMAEDLVDLQRVAQDGMRVRASAGAASFRRQPTLEEALAEAQAQVEALRREQEDDPKASNERQKQARRRAAEERAARVAAALARMPELEAKKKPDEKDKARCSTTDPEATVMKMANGGFRSEE